MFKIFNLVFVIGLVYQTLLRVFESKIMDKNIEKLYVISVKYDLKSFGRGFWSIVVNFNEFCIFAGSIINLK